MTEKEKMLRGLLYNADHDPELDRDRLRCKDLCWEFNALRPSRREEQTALLRKLLGKTGENVTIGSDVVIAAGSVVNRDIPSHVVAAGNPCRVIRPITDADRESVFGCPD